MMATVKSLMMRLRHFLFRCAKFIVKGMVRVLVFVPGLRVLEFVFSPIVNLVTGSEANPDISLGDFPEGLAANKIFVTGVSGSGKTSFAQQYAAEQALAYISFDDIHDYDSERNQSKAILSGLPSSFVIDAIPIDEDASWRDFFEYQRENDVLVVCVYCPDHKEWLRRRSAKRLQGLSRNLRSYRDVIFFLKCLYGRARGKEVIIDPQEELMMYRSFFTGNLPSLRRLRYCVLFYDSLANEFTTEEVMLERIRYQCFPLMDHLDELDPESYDKCYQDIEILDFVGHTESYRTWEAIKGLVDWRGKAVIDLGCFHGYFSFKVEDCGGVVQGLDRSESVLATARMINDIRGGDVVFREWVGGDDIPECDVILCLNVLHHFGDSDAQNRAVSKMDCETAIFEIYRKHQPIIEKHFGEVIEFESHRSQRVILLCQNKRA